MMISDNEAKALEIGSKAALKVLDMSERAVSALAAGPIGQLVSNFIGVAGGDWLGESRKRNLAKLQKNTEDLLQGIDKARQSPPSVNVVRPLLEAAADESREALQDLWAALLANASVDDGGRVRRDFFEKVKQMEPDDARALRIVASRMNKDARDEAHLQIEAGNLNHARAQIGMRDLTWQVSIEKLEIIGLIKKQEIDYVRCAAAVTLTPYAWGFPQLTVFGEALCLAVSSPN